MNDLAASFWRALTALFHPRMLWLTFWPFLVAIVGWGLVFWFGSETLTGWVGEGLRHWSQGWTANGWVSDSIVGWFGSFAAGMLHLVVAPFVVAALAIPLIAISTLLLIAGMSMPAVLRHLSLREFAGLEAREGGSWYGSLGHAAVATLVVLAVILITLPLWLVPPLFVVLPPLLWGWLSYRVMSYDALAAHATGAERRALCAAHRWPLLAIGVATGLLGSLPTLLWASSLMLLVLFPIVAVVAIWLYVVIFVFSALWFAHYCLSALRSMRMRQLQTTSRMAVG